MSLDLLTRRAELRNVVTMAVPVVITTSSRALMDVVDYAMIASLDLEAAQAAILPAQLIMWSYIVMGMGTVSLVSTFASQAMGKGRYRECSGYAWQGVYVAILVGILAVAARPMLPALIALMGHAQGVQDLEIAYTHVALLTTGPTVAAAALGWFFIGIHRPWVTTWSVIDANVINFAVSAVLIFGYLGFEPMGIAGAAWGTLVGVSYRAVRLMFALLLPSVDETFCSRSTWKPSWAKIKQVLRYGLPAGLHWVSEVAVWAIFINILVGAKFGTVHLVATNTAWQYMRIGFMPMLGMSQALTALVGKSIGAGNPERAMRETRYAAILTMTYLGILSTIYVIFRHELIAIFNDDPVVVDIGGGIMTCAAVFQLFDALGITYDGALRGAGDTFVPAVFMVASTWFVLIGVAWWIVGAYPELGSLGPWLAATALIAITAIFLWWRWHSRAWMKINVFAATPESEEVEPAV